MPKVRTCVVVFVNGKMRSFTTKDAAWAHIARRLAGRTPVRSITILYN